MAKAPVAAEAVRRTPVGAVEMPAPVAMVAGTTIAFSPTALGALPMVQPDLKPSPWDQGVARPKIMRRVEAVAVQSRYERP
ncbi:MAG: hypothetical protein R3C68_17845 [Myxococcota bacterium]